MITSLLYDDQKHEIEQLNNIIHEIAAKLTDEKWDIHSVDEQSKLERYLKEKPIIDFFLYNVMRKGDIEKLIEIREQYQLAFVLLIADQSLSPMKYIRPGINAQSLLLRPFSEEQAYETVYDFVKEYLNIAYLSNNENRPAIVLDTENGKISVPYDQIYYIEALDKKIYICIGVESYGFYSTLDGLMENLPDIFARCHRSYIVNKTKIRKLALSKNTVYLQDGYEVPMSRSYKQILKEVYDDNKII